MKLRSLLFGTGKELMRFGAYAGLLFAAVAFATGGMNKGPGGVDIVNEATLDVAYLQGMQIHCSNIIGSDGDDDDFCTDGGGSSGLDFASVWTKLDGSDGTYVVPDGATSLEVLVVGAGGGGAAGTEKWSNARQAGEGGGAGEVVVEVLSVTSGDEFSYSIGAGGTGAPYPGHNTQGESGGDGGDSSFDDVVAEGGTGGVSVADDAATGGAGVGSLAGNEPGSLGDTSSIGAYASYFTPGGGGDTPVISLAVPSEFFGAGGGDGGISGYWSQDSGRPSNSHGSDGGVGSGGGGGAGGTITHATYFKSSGGGDGGDGIILVRPN